MLEQQADTSSFRFLLLAQQSIKDRCLLLEQQTETSCVTAGSLLERQAETRAVSCYLNSRQRPAVSELVLASLSNRHLSWLLMLEQQADTSSLRLLLLAQQSSKDRCLLLEQQTETSCVRAGSCYLTAGRDQVSQSWFLLLEQQTETSCLRAVSNT